MGAFYQSVAGTFIPLGLTLIAVSFVTDTRDVTLLVAGIVLTVGGFTALLAARGRVDSEHRDALKRECELDLRVEERHKQLVGLLKSISDGVRSIQGTGDDIQNGRAK